APLWHASTSTFVHPQESLARRRTLIVPCDVSSTTACIHCDPACFSALTSLPPSSLCMSSQNTHGRRTTPRLLRHRPNQSRNGTATAAGRFPTKQSPRGRTGK
ncbi:unnamed protein product, partial [Ectocarpus sp. 4 AP-2014]